MMKIVLGEVKGIYNRITLIEICSSLLWVITGLILTFNPTFGNVAFSVVIGVVFIVTGLSTLYSFFKRGTILLYNLNIIYGCIMLLLGILTLIFHNALQIFLGIYLLFLGIQKLTYGLVLKRFEESSWLLTLVVGILFIVMGIISFFGHEMVTIYGVYLLGYGLIDIVNVILLRKRSNFYIA